MTSKERKIITDAVERHWRDLKKLQELYGNESPVTCTARNKWISLHYLCEELGIEYEI